MRRINSMSNRIIVEQLGVEFVVNVAVILLLLATDHCYSAHTLEWTSQLLPSPFEGRHTGVATHDINGDGYLDVLFAAGRHGVDQSFALINLGYQKDGTFRFSDPIRIGDPGGFYQIDASPLSSLEDNHVAVLLAGGTCAEKNRTCIPETHQPAVILDVFVTGCSVMEPDMPCNSTFAKIWQDATPAGDRNGAFAPTLGDGLDPALVLAGNGCVSIFEPKNGVYTNPPSFVLIPEDKVPDDVNNTIKRGSGLDCGYVGNLPGLVVGLRTRWAPSPLVAVYRTADGSYDWFDFASSNHSYREGNGTQPIDTTAVALGDLNGDGTADVVESNFVRSTPSLQDTNTIPIPQLYYLLNSDPSQDTADIPGFNLFNSTAAGRSVDIGQIYNDSALPDVAHGMSDGTVRLFANLGLDRNDNFLGFEQRDTFKIQDGYCEIRDVKIASLWNCTVSILCAVDCAFGNVIYTRSTCVDNVRGPWDPPNTSMSNDDSSNDGPRRNSTGVNGDLWPPHR